MTNFVKYPRTFHLPFSPGKTSDDKTLYSLKSFENKEVVITEKMDGENTTLYFNGLHARSIDGKNHPSRDWIKAYWSTFSYKIQPNVRVCGENLYAKHSIKYENLDSFFYGFSVWENDKCYSWDETLKVFDDLNIQSVPVLYRGLFNEKLLHEIATNLDTTKQEGFVVRLTESFSMENFNVSVAKYVRENHVQTDNHWMHSNVEPNILRS